MQEYSLKRKDLKVMAYDYSRRYGICISEYSSYYAKVCEDNDEWKMKEGKFIYNLYIIYI